MRIGITGLILFLITGPVVSQTPAPDFKFGHEGWATADFSGREDHAWALAVQTDGKLILAGDSGPDGFAVTRFTADGKPDSGFAVNGKLLFTFSRQLDIRAIAVQNDGKIVLAGSWVDNSYYRSLFVGRLNPDGSWDTGFRNTGYQNYFVSNNSDQVLAMKILPSGKILLAGQAYNGGITRFLIVRLTADGFFDTTFSGDGIQTLNGLGPNGSDYLTGMTTDAAGKILLTGLATQTNFQSWLTVVRLTAGGSLDNTFGTSGKVSLPGDFNQPEVVVQPDGKIVVGCTVYRNQNSDLQVIRLKSNGSPDSSFAQNGVFTGSLSEGYDSFTGITVDPDNRILTCGYFTSESQDVAVALCLDPAGQPVTSFGESGAYTVKIPGSLIPETIYAPQSSTFFMAGALTESGKTDFGLVRLTETEATSVTQSQFQQANFTLLPNFPNPFNPSTEIPFFLSGSAQVTVQVFDLLGRETIVLFSGSLPSGTHSVTFSAKGLPSGVYFSRLTVNGRSESRKMVLCK
ncbi:MAG: T9SS type A sorting domain-containing protein [Bacteroidetes bacterium]|nr:T9SS type A sorting domain-containing protein [Bacteroidota bacterium]